MKDLIILGVALKQVDAGFDRYSKVKLGTRNSRKSSL